MSDTPTTLSSRREFLFLYDIKMGNPNGDPDENRPRVLPDGTHYVTDVRLKRFVRDYFKSLGRDILVDTIEGNTTNLAGRVAHFLAASNRKKVENPQDVVSVLLDAFIDARLFGSTFAFKGEKDKSGGGHADRNAATDTADASEEESPESDIPEDRAAKKQTTKSSKKDSKSKLLTLTTDVRGSNVTVQWAQPKTLTGATQIQHGEVKHKAREVDIHGTSVFASAEGTRGTFTTYFGLRYALIAFHGVANEHSAALSKMTDADYDDLLKAMWYGVRSAANTRTKRGQVPHLLLSVEYKPGQEFQFGRLSDYVRLSPRNGKPEMDWSSPEDYAIDLSVLAERLSAQMSRMHRIRYCFSPDVVVYPRPGSEEWTTRVTCPAEDLALDQPSKEQSR
jgi:CRISPR-associated protein Csh2